MAKLAYRTAGSPGSAVKGNLPDDFVTEFIDPNLLTSLDGWTVDEDIVVQSMLDSNQSKLDSFHAKREIEQKAAVEAATQAQTNPNINDLMRQLNDMKIKQDQLQKLIENKINQDGYV